MAWGFFGGEQRSGDKYDSRFNYGKGINGVDAPPNLWDQSGEAKQNLLAGLQGSRPIIGQNDYAGNAQAYGQTGLQGQMNAMELFRQNANGTGGPSLAQLQLQQGTDMNNRAAMGLMGQSRGGNLAGAYSQALGAQSGANLQLGQNTALLRAQEQLAAQQAYAGMANQMAQQGMGYDQMNLQNALGQDQNALGWYSAKRGLDMQASQNKFNRNMQIGGMVLGGVSALGQVVGGAVGSDVRVKEDLRPISALDAAAQVEPLAYRYKPGMGPEGQQIGVSAQQLAGTPLGSTLVGQDQNGMLNVDGGRAGIAALAASGENARRLRMLEQQLAQQSGEGGNMAQRFGTREEGMANTRRAQMLSDQMSAERGVANLRRDQPQDYDFSGSPQMRRGVAQTIDPFTSSTVGPNTTQGLAGLRARYFPELTT